MGTVNYTIHHAVTGNAFLVRWASLSTSSNSLDIGLPFPSSVDLALAGSLFSDKSVQVYTFQTASNTQVLMQGCNMMDVVATESMIWATLTDPQGNALSFRTTGATEPQRIETILENPWYIRPMVLVCASSDLAYATVQTTIDMLITSVRSERAGS